MYCINVSDLLLATLLGIVSAVSAYTVSKRWIFKKLRLWAKKQHEVYGREWVYELCCCHWCLSFWFALFYTLVFHPIPYSLLVERDWYSFLLMAIFTWFYIASIATITLSRTLDRGK